MHIDINLFFNIGAFGVDVSANGTESLLPTPQQSTNFAPANIADAQ